MLLRHHGASRLSGHLEVARSVASGLGVSGRKPTSRSKNCFDASPDSPLLGLVPKEQPLSSRTRRRVLIYYLGQSPISLIGGARLSNNLCRLLAAICLRNIFPEIKVTLGVHPNNIGHTDFPGLLPLS